MVGARAMVWIAETLSPCGRGFRQRSVQFRPVSSTRRPRSALPAFDFVSDAAEGAPVLSALSPGDNGRCAGDGAEDVEDGLHTHRVVRVVAERGGDRISCAWRAEG